MGEWASGGETRGVASRCEPNVCSWVQRPWPRTPTVEPKHALQIKYRGTPPSPTHLCQLHWTERHCVVGLIGISDKQMNGDNGHMSGTGFAV